MGNCEDCICDKAEVISDEVLEVSFLNDLESVINKHSRENNSNTPDFILATLLYEVLSAFDKATKSRERWYGVSLNIMNDWQELIMTAIGEASTCWDNLEGAGVFDSSRADAIGKKLLADIKGGE